MNCLPSRSAQFASLEKKKKKKKLCLCKKEVSIISDSSKVTKFKYSSEKRESFNFMDDLIFTKSLLLLIALLTLIAMVSFSFAHLFCLLLFQCLQGKAKLS